MMCAVDAAEEVTQAGPERRSSGDGVPDPPAFREALDESLRIWLDNAPRIGILS